MFRKGFFTMLSAHSGTGYGVNSGTLYVTDWGALAPAAIVIVMTFGGMAGSTTGGVKGARLGLAAKGLAQDIRRVLLPDAALVVSTYHSGRRRILRTPELQSATVLVLLYFLTYLGGAVVALLYGEWDITETLFESVSAAANVGLSIGIVGPDIVRFGERDQVHHRVGSPRAVEAGGPATPHLVRATYTDPPGDPTTDPTPRPRRT
jgi:trk system potassium uptake protein TrkH